MKVNVEFIEKKAKKEWNLSVQQLVSIPQKRGGLGFHPTWWTKIKRGEFNLTEENAKQLAKILECDVPELFLMEEPKPVDDQMILGLLKSNNLMLQRIMKEFSIE